MKERDDDEIDHQRPHGNLPLGRGLCQQLADRKPEAEHERVEYHEEHPRPADQDGLSGLCHSAPLSRADDPTAVSTRPIASVVMALSTTGTSLAEHTTVPMPTMTTLCLPSGVNHGGHRHDQGRKADRTYADAHRALIIRMG